MCVCVTHSGAQGLLLALNLGIAPDGAQGEYAGLNLSQMPPRQTVFTVPSLQSVSHVYLLSS